MFCNKSTLFILTITSCFYSFVNNEALNADELQFLGSPKTLKYKEPQEVPVALSDPLNLKKNLTELSSLPNPILTYETHLRASSILFGLTSIANESLVSEVCHQELKKIQAGVLHKQIWAMKVLDASGSKPAGFMFQNDFWLGSKEVCDVSNQPLRITKVKLLKRTSHAGIIEEVPPFKVEYRIVYMKHNSPWQLEFLTIIRPLLKIGLCLPASCATDEIKVLTQELMQQKIFSEADLFDFKPEVLYVKDLKLQNSFFEKRSLKLIVAVLVFTGVMMLSASYLNKINTVGEETSKANSVIKADSVENKTGYRVLFLNGLINFVNCFDIRENSEKLFATKPSISNDIPIINGLRSVAAFLIVSLHVVFYMMQTIQNLPFVWAYLEMKELQMHNIAILFVEAFFTISGFLQTYNFLRNTQQIEAIRLNTFLQNAKQFCKMLFHRYLRLAPLYFVLMGLSDILSAYINDTSCFNMIERYDLVCPKNWWHNVLFIQSYFGHEDICLSWSWSLANEMQYFILATILLFSYVKHPKFVKATVLAILSGSLMWSLVSGMRSKFQFSFEALNLTCNEIYLNPVIRAFPYMLGSIAGWYLISGQRVLNISSMLEKLLWNLTAVFFVVSPYAMYWRDLEPLISISLFILARAMISLAVCWMILGSATGRNIWWSRILEAKIFQHVNRLTYAIYLLNPFIITLFVSLRNTSIQLDFFILGIFCCGFSVLIYLVSIGFSLAFEIPYCNWSSIILKRNKSKIA